MEIKLDKYELDLCEYIGKQRSNIARSNNVFDAKIGNQNGVEADVQGFKAEYAFAKYINVFPDFGLTDVIRCLFYNYELQGIKWMFN